MNAGYYRMPILRRLREEVESSRALLERMYSEGNTSAVAWSARNILELAVGASLRARRTPVGHHG